MSFRNTKSNQKGKYIIIPTGGLCNRLRVIASVLEMIDSTQNDIEIIWHKSKECSAEFTQICLPHPTTSTIISSTLFTHWTIC